jgi:hypothetical protein
MLCLFVTNLVLKIQSVNWTTFGIPASATPVEHRCVAIRSSVVLLLSGGFINGKSLKIEVVLLF